MTRSTQFFTKKCVCVYIYKAATNDYFDSRLVGRLSFQLIDLKNLFFFFYKKTLLHILPNMKTYSA